jgi:hypothetical protein
MDTTFSNLVKKIKDLKYSIKYLQYRHNDNNKISNLIYYTKKQPYYNNNHISNNNSKNIKDRVIIKKQGIFKVIALSNADTYEIYSYNNKTSEYDYYSQLMIPSYKISVTMNSLFRKIKENDNLDALEESDDEDDDDECGGDNEDKYIIKGKEMFILCELSYKFKKWVPIKEIQLSCTHKVALTNDVIHLLK